VVRYGRYRPPLEVSGPAAAVLDAVRATAGVTAAEVASRTGGVDDRQAVRLLRRLELDRAVELTVDDELCHDLLAAGRTRCTIPEGGRR
jgi:hypothetical protein